MKLLLLDIETAPNTAYVWGLFKENIPLARLVESGYVLCWSAKWYDSKEILFDSVYNSGHKKMLKNIHTLLEEADVVIHYNGTKFDIPTLNKEFIKFGFKPPSPYKQVDLLNTSRQQFRFVSNKLDYVANALGVGKKVDHRGFQLWIDCMNGDHNAWKEMEEYNRQDVVILEGVYEKFKPWIKNHPNRFIYSNETGCPICGSDTLHKRGYAYTTVGRYQRYQCKKCGTWSRGFKNLNDTKQIQKYS